MSLAVCRRPSLHLPRPRPAHLFLLNSTPERSEKSKASTKAVCLQRTVRYRLCTCLENLHQYCCSELIMYVHLLRISTAI